MESGQEETPPELQSRRGFLQLRVRLALDACHGTGESKRCGISPRLLTFRSPSLCYWRAGGPGPAFRLRARGAWWPNMVVKVSCVILASCSAEWMEQIPARTLSATLGRVATPHSVAFAPIGKLPGAKHPPSLARF